MAGHETGGRLVWLAVGRQSSSHTTHTTPNLHHHHHSSQPEVLARDFDLLYGVNVKALFLLTQRVTRALVDAGQGGAVVHVSSQSSTLALTEHLVYSTSKAAVDHAARIQALELGKHGIRVNTVCGEGVWGWGGGRGGEGVWGGCVGGGYPFLCH